MKILISPSKSLDFDSKIISQDFSIPNFLDDSKILIEELRKLSKNDISKLMNISEKLSELNFERYKNFKTPFNEKNSKPAIYVFSGDVYDGINIENYSKKEIEYAQNNLRILSGLYGILKPLDLIQPYRLEMSTKLKNKRGKNLYEFWQEKLTDFLNQDKDDFIINLASEEYFSAINHKNIKAKIINIVFKENKDGKLKIIGIHAKKARGFMVDYLIKNNIKKAEDIKNFDVLGYKFSPKNSDQDNLVFCR